jgi:hypothetical protein
MEPLKSIGERYWIAYYLVYVITAGVGLWRYQPWQQSGNDELYALVAIFALAAGVALLAAILMEVIGRMVLLIPSEIKRLKEMGRKEGRVEGRKEGRQEERQRILNEVAQLGDQVPTEVLEILKGDSNANGSNG